MTAAKKGPLERAVGAELRAEKIVATRRGLAAAALVLAARADELPDVPLAVTCPDCEMRVELDPELWRPSPADLAKLMGELRQTLVTLTQKDGDDGPLAALARQLGATPPGGPPVGHPEAT